MRLKLLTAAALGAVLTAALLEIFHVGIGQNFHVVLPGQVYRCAQPSGPELDRLIRDHGIRTVVNLRGTCAGFPWYEDEAQATFKGDICQEDINLSAGRLPSTTEMRRLVEVLDRTEYPILLHCKRGADRTGMTSAIVRMLLTDASFEQARSELGVRFGHLSIGRTANLDWFFSLYSDWLKSTQQTHSRQLFRRWLLEEYHAGRCNAQLEILSPGLSEMSHTKPRAFQVRVTNRSNLTWQLNPSMVAGVHLVLQVFDDSERLVSTEKFGFFKADIQPGQSVDLTVVTPPLNLPGRYRWLIDMLDEGHCVFNQGGSVPLEGVLHVHE